MDIASACAQALAPVACESCILSFKTVTARISARSADTRAAYLERIRAAAAEGPARGELGCANLAHGFAACGPDEKLHLRADERRNVAIVSAYNDMLSAHQPLERYPAILKKAVLQAGGVAQFAGGVPAMCDGITQGRAGMELSLFSRDVVAMATAVALSHDMFDAALMLGVCDKIVPGLLIGALSFGHLPTVFVPAGPMPSGPPERREVPDPPAPRGGQGRPRRAARGRVAVLSLGRHLHVLRHRELEPARGRGDGPPPAGRELRQSGHAAAARADRGGRRGAATHGCAPIGEILDERALVNGVVALLATGGSTNHTMHLVAVAAAAGLQLTWDDFADLSAVVPLLARVYPNGAADINHFHAAGGMPFLLGELLDAGLMHPDVDTVAGHGLGRYRDEPYLDDEGELRWRPAERETRDGGVLRPAARAFAPDGGIRVLDGALGRAVIKVSAVAPEHRVVTAPGARVRRPVATSSRRSSAAISTTTTSRSCATRARARTACRSCTSSRPRSACCRIAATASRWSPTAACRGASGKVPAAIHCTPEAAAGGPLARVRDGDVVRLDAETGRLEVDVDLGEREP